MGLIVKFARVILGCREDEPIIDCFERHKVAIKKIFYRGHNISRDDLIEALKECGIMENDSLMVHASWKEFFNYDGTPDTVIKNLLELIGKNGTLVMPCYGVDNVIFDVDNDASAAGVLSEVFRTYYGVIRSRGSHFSCAALGKYDKYVTGEHEKSKYGFDEHSPYYKFAQLENSKILMLGLGKRSVKLSLYHLPEMIMRNTDLFYNSLFNETYSSSVIFREYDKIIERHHHDMIDRAPTMPNRKNIYMIYKQDFSTHRKISNLDIVVLDAKEALKYMLKKSESGHYMIKPH